MALTIDWKFKQVRVAFIHETRLNQVMLAYFIEETETSEGSGICSKSMVVTNDMAGLKLRSARPRGPWAAGFVWPAQSGPGTAGQVLAVCADSLHMQIRDVMHKKSSVQSHEQILNYAHFISPDM